PETIQIKKSQRIQSLPPYLFASIDRVKKELLARGVDVINLGVGDPDTPTPAHIVARLAEAAGKPANHRYPDYEGLLAFRQAAAECMAERYGVRVAPAAFFADAIRFAERHGVILCHDAAYAEIYFGARPPSILEIPGGRDVAIEFHSLSKTFNMTGWRVGFAVGNPQLIAGLGQVKTNVDSGVFQAVQEAAIAALSGDYAVVERLRATYRERRDVLVAGLGTVGLPCDAPAG